jgi:hypothetical protein
MGRSSSNRGEASSSEALQQITQSILELVETIHSLGSGGVTLRVRFDSGTAPIQESPRRRRRSKPAKKQRPGRPRRLVETEESNPLPPTILVVPESVPPSEERGPEERVEESAPRRDEPESEVLPGSGEI